MGEKGCQSRVCIAQVSSEDKIESEDIPPSDEVVLILLGLRVYCIVLRQTSPVARVGSAGTVRRPADGSIDHLNGHRSVMNKYVREFRVIRRSNEGINIVLITRSRQCSSNMFLDACLRLWGLVIRHNQERKRKRKEKKNK